MRHRATATAALLSLAKQDTATVVPAKPGLLNNPAITLLIFVLSGLAGVLSQKGNREDIKLPEPLTNSEECCEVCSWAYHLRQYAKNQRRMPRRKAMMYVYPAGFSLEGGASPGKEEEEEV